MTQNRKQYLTRKLRQLRSIEKSIIDSYVYYSQEALHAIDKALSDLNREILAISYEIDYDLEFI